MKRMLSTILKDNGFKFSINILDVGAVPIEGEPPEAYYRLLDDFPLSRLSGFELDAGVCEQLNRHAPNGAHFYQCALGQADEKRTLYLAHDPMCTSLYEVDERYVEMFGRMEGMRSAGQSEIETITLDRFACEKNLGAVDFLKIDVQGAELDIFKGGSGVLRDVLFMVCEVEFVQIYKNQPLFSDVDSWLRQRGFVFHRFLGMGGRVAKPLSVRGRSDYPSQFLWTDAVYVRDLFACRDLTGEQQLKLAVLFDLYESRDLALHLLQCYDSANDDDLAALYLEHLRAGGTWDIHGAVSEK